MGVVKAMVASKSAPPKLARTWSNTNGEILTEVVLNDFWSRLVTFDHFRHFWSFSITNRR
jgi:hypothetical protein